VIWIRSIGYRLWRSANIHIKAERQKAGAHDRGRETAKGRQEARGYDCPAGMVEQICTSQIESIVESGLSAKELDQKD
jgi:hypothetical protein